MGPTPNKAPHDALSSPSSASSSPTPRPFVLGIAGATCSGTIRNLLVLSNKGNLNFFFFLLSLSLFFFFKKGKSTLSTYLKTVYPSTPVISLDKFHNAKSFIDQFPSGRRWINWETTVGVDYDAMLAAVDRETTDWFSSSSLLLLLAIENSKTSFFFLFFLSQSLRLDSIDVLSLWNDVIPLQQCCLWQAVGDCRGFFDFGGRPAAVKAG